MSEREELQNSVATTNACKLCTPLGACLAFRGIKGAVPFLHGSQGCATYIRRYLISHFREPMDIASSGIDETSSIFGGGENFLLGLANVSAQYEPQLLGVATTCLSETIGEDISLYLKKFQQEFSGDQIPVISVATPSYQGTHVDGFYRTVREIVVALAEEGRPSGLINLIPGLVSPADLRYLKEVGQSFGIELVLLPDYSETLDGVSWETYHKIPPGGTEITAIKSMGTASATIEFGLTVKPENSPGELLRQSRGIPCRRLGLPIGMRLTDRFFQTLQELGPGQIPPKFIAERGRLLDAYVDGHKYLFQKRAVLYGEEDLVIGMASFLAEIGVIPVLCASGGRSGQLQKELYRVAPELAGQIMVKEGVDFMAISALAEELKPDLLLGNSKGYSLARRMGIPLVRIGFPIHDRIGGQRILHLGYEGAQRLFDLLVNTLLERKQSNNQVGYSYL